VGEFELIKRFFSPERYAADVCLGVGDDAAVVIVPSGQRLVAAVDTLVSGVHFPDNTPAADIGWRALAVNLSDMAAMGATPRWFTLSLCMPVADERWLAEFANGLRAAAEPFDVQLIGGDTVKGPLNISVQILGLVEADGWLTRAGAHPGDVLFVSGAPGEAAGGLRVMQESLHGGTSDAKHLLQRFLRPEPRVMLGRALRNVATAAMDVSDGLLVDLSKLSAASGCGAQLFLDTLPQSPALHRVFGAKMSEQLMLNGGDDYELLFTAPAESAAQVAELASQVGVTCSRIGVMDASGRVQCLRNGKPVAMDVRGYDHFS